MENYWEIKGLGLQAWPKKDTSQIERTFSRLQTLHWRISKWVMLGDTTHLKVHPNEYLKRAESRNQGISLPWFLDYSHSHLLALSFREKLWERAGPSLSVLSGFILAPREKGGLLAPRRKQSPSKQPARQSWVCAGSSPRPSSIPFSNPWASALHPPPFFVPSFLPLSLTNSHKYIGRCGFNEVCQWLLSMNEFSILWSVIA